MEDFKEFKITLAKILKEEELNGIQAAKILNMKPQQVSRYLNGKSTPSIDQANRIINKLGRKLWITK